MFKTRAAIHSPRTWKSLPLAILAIVLCAVVASAASYVRTTLQELTQRAIGIAEIEVVERTYPQMKAGDTFPRTHVDVKVLRSLKGSLPEHFVLDMPGGINGNIISTVPDSPEFRVGERAMVFVKEPEKGHFMVQDLGLGKFNIVQRDNKKFVESPLCSRAIENKVATQEDLEANLLTRSIPYDTFCNMVLSYAAGKPTEDAARLAAVLPPSTVHLAIQAPAVVSDFDEMERAARARTSWLTAGAALAFAALLAAFWVRRRRQMKAGPASMRNAALLMGAALLAGGIGGVTSHAFVQFDQKTIWNLDVTKAGKVESNKVVWKQSTAVSKTNANSFDGVTQSFNRWEAVSSSRLAFTNGGATAVAVNDSKDTENVVAWTSTPTNDFSNKTLAITFSSFTVGTTSNFVDGDIIFNDRDFNWATGGSGNSASVSLHEIGHFIGLNHSTDSKAVMFPFDGGLVNLSSDEISAAQTMYPGPADPTAPVFTPPNSNASASPTTGDPSLTVSFDGSGSSAGSTGAAITSFDWDFGDGAKAAGALASHTYTVVGTYTAALTVTDANNQTAVSSVEINVGKPFTILKGTFKLNFKTLGHDGIAATLASDKLIGIKAAKGTGQILHGSLLIGDQEWLFDFDTEKLKSTQRGGPAMKVNDKLGTATVTVKNTDLRDVLGGHGAVNSTTSAEVSVPLTFWFGEGSGLYLFGSVKFQYTAQENKSGVGIH